MQALAELFEEHKVRRARAPQAVGIRAWRVRCGAGRTEAPVAASAPAACSNSAQPASSFPPSPVASPR